MSCVFVVYMSCVCRPVFAPSCPAILLSFSRPIKEIKNQTNTGMSTAGGVETDGRAANTHHSFALVLRQLQGNQQWEYSDIYSYSRV